MASLFIKKSDQFETTAGAPASGYYLHFLTVGTTTPKNTYPTEADAIAGTNANTNPITLNAAGRSANDIWISGRYRFIFSDNATPGSGTTLDTALIEDVVPASGSQTETSTWGGTAGGTASAITLTLTPVPSAYTDGMPIRFRVASDSTGATTVNVNGLGAKSIVRYDGTALVAGDLQQNDVVTIVYDSVNNRFMLQTTPLTSVAYLNVNQSWTKAQGVNRSALTDAATIAVDASLSNVFTVTLGGNRTLGQPTNPKDGQSITIFITQDGTGTRTLAYHADWLFAGGVDPTLSTAAGALDVLTGVYNGATTKWCASLSKAFA